MALPIAGCRSVCKQLEAFMTGVSGCDVCRKVAGWGSAVVLLATVALVARQMVEALRRT